MGSANKYTTTKRPTRKRSTTTQSTTKPSTTKKPTALTSTSRKSTAPTSTTKKSTTKILSTKTEPTSTTRKVYLTTTKNDSDKTDSNLTFNSTSFLPGRHDAQVDHVPTIIGAVCGVVAALAIAVGVFCMWRRLRKKDNPTRKTLCNLTGACDTKPGSNLSKAHNKECNNYSNSMPLDTFDRLSAESCLEESTRKHNENKIALEVEYGGEMCKGLEKVEASGGDEFTCINSLRSSPRSSVEYNNIAQSYNQFNGLYYNTGVSASGEGTYSNITDTPDRDSKTVEDESQLDSDYVKYSVSKIELENACSNGMLLTDKHVYSKLGDNGRDAKNPYNTCSSVLVTSKPMLASNNGDQIVVEEEPDKTISNYSVSKSISEK